MEAKPGNCSNLLGGVGGLTLGLTLKDEEPRDGGGIPGTGNIEAKTKRDNKAA